MQMARNTGAGMNATTLHAECPSGHPMRKKLVELTCSQREEDHLIRIPPLIPFVLFIRK